jgi:signal transduction histidine kinase
MTIQTRLLLMTSSILIVAFITLSYINYQQAIKNAQQDLFDQADKVRNLLMAYRHTGQTVFLEQKLPITEKTLGLLPAHAIGQMSKIYLRWDKSGFSFNNVSDRPRNPEHQADVLELEIMEYFREEDTEDIVFKPFTTEKGEKYYIYARPIWIKKSCLKCHSTPENAPKTIREKYASAYNYKLGDLRGILSIKMPAATIEKRARAVFYSNAKIQFLAMLIIFVLVMFIIRNSLIKPINLLSHAIIDISNGDYSKRINGLDGEFEDIQKSYNIMGYELEMNQKELENRVAQRTKELNINNEILKETLDTLQKTQSQLVESEKMAALGGLVAGVAHEINTPLGVGVTAASHLETLNTSIKNKLLSNNLKKSELENYFNDSDETGMIILNNLNRAADLIRSFKLIAVDQSQDNKRIFNIEKYIQEILVSLKPALKKTKLSIDFNCPKNIEINCNPGQLSQVISNLFMNSITHAFDNNQPGLLTLVIKQEPEKLSFHYSDNGKGISKENINKIYTPFFTTARHKGGSGLGLSTIYNIITQNMDGSIRCESIEGQGTDFYFEIKCAQTE